VVISKHLTADPPPIGAHCPELSDFGPAFDKALAKLPADRYDRCVDFARALAHRMDAPQTGSDATVLAQPATGPRHARRPSVSRPRRRLVVSLAAVLALIVVSAVGFVLFDRMHERSAEANPSPSAPGTVALPVVVVGADCATLGAAGITEDEAPAYCAHLPTVDKTIWSLYPGKVAGPTMTAAPGDEVYPSETEAPVLVCMEQTGKSKLECHDDILQSNASPSASPTS
jgi:serine/threonine protein kinase, bacterial